MVLNIAFIFIGIRVIRLKEWARKVSIFIGVLYLANAFIIIGYMLSGGGDFNLYIFLYALIQGLIVYGIIMHLANQNVRSKFK